MSIIFTLNVFIYQLFTPVNVQFHPSSETVVGQTSIRSNQNSVMVYTSPKMKSGGLGAFSADVYGYVNMVEPEDIIHTRTDTLKVYDIVHEDGKLPESSNGFFMVHEFAHILQKHLVSKTAGGYPSPSNPIRSGRYYYYLTKLDRDLQALMPPVSHYATFPGLEAAADCYARSYFGNYETLSSYVQACSKKQSFYAERFFEDQTWPLSKSAFDAREDVTIKNASAYYVGKQKLRHLHAIFPFATTIDLIPLAQKVSMNSLWDVKERLALTLENEEKIKETYVPL